MRSVVFFLVSAITGGLGFQKWDGMRVTWCFNPANDPKHCFQSVPRTVREAEASGWHELHTSGGCHNDGKFNGRRFIKGEELALSPLYDRNGIIAGIQMNLVKDELFAIPNPFKYDQVGDYLDNEIAGRPAYSMTFYFISPNKICSIGRSEQELHTQGTGTSLWIQVGPNPHSHNLFRAPVYRDVAIREKWSDNLCVPTMGHHNYYNVERMSDSYCTKMRPSFLLYNNAGEMIGYGATAVGNMSSPSFEHPDEAAVKTGLGSMTPECMIKNSYNPRYSNMHMFLVDQPWNVSATCSPVAQVEHSNEVYITPNSKERRPWYHHDHFEGHHF